MTRDEAILDVAGLLVDGVALNQAVLDGDLSEGRFRASLIVREAALLERAEVQNAAAEVVRLLGTPDHLPLPGYALAILALSHALDDLAGSLRD